MLQKYQSLPESPAAAVPRCTHKRITLEDEAFCCLKTPATMCLDSLQALGMGEHIA